MTKSKRPPIRWLNLLVLGLPPLVCVTAVPWYGFTHGYDVYEWAWFVILMIFCEMSITAGYHRLWSHRSYKANPIIKFIYALGGACALQNNCITWAADHRRHHLHVDDNERDPYSAGLGFWYSHFGWMIRDYDRTKDDLSNVKDLINDPILAWQKRHYLTLLLLMNIGLPVFLGYLHGDIIGSLLLAGFLRLVLSQHFTYLINSAAHIWGSREFSPKQTARDNWFIALFTFGEGYHNYHHTFAFDYRNGIKWYHYDPTKWLIKSLHCLGLTSDLRTCSAFKLERSQLDIQYQSALKKCESMINPHLWQERLQKEYHSLSSTLNSWYELKQQSYLSKTQAWQDKLHELDLNHLKARVEELRSELKDQRKNWQQLQHRFSLESSAA